VDPIEVAIALIEREGRWLVQQRQVGKHLAGTWEFPGGKVTSGETAPEAAVREVREELGLRVAIDVTLPTVGHDYGERQVVLHPFMCRIIDGAPRAVEGQEIRWVDLDRLLTLPIPEANRPLLEALCGEPHGRGSSDTPPT
jgi:mutator protein MutT